MLSKKKQLCQFNSFKTLNQTVVHCRLCPRLAKFREEVPARAAYQSESYWRKPIPGFGDAKGELLILGLAPAAHGGNRTGRVFTGDESGRFLINALYQAGFANQPHSESRDDGLALYNCYITAAVKCVPPQNKPSKAEICTCSQYLHAEIGLLHNLKCVLALGKLAFDAYAAYLKKRHPTIGPLRFEHGARYEFSDTPLFYGCYHPSPRNTYTKTLTFEMIVSLLKLIRQNLVDSA